MRKFNRVLAVVLLVAIAMSLIACQKTETPPETTESKYAEYAGIVADPTTWIGEFEALPIPTADMTTDQLRQICVDAFKANMTFPWTPNIPVKYTYILGGKSTDVVLSTGRAYSGLCYATGVADATVGSIHKLLPYYDKETGVLDVEAMGGKYLSIITSACSLGALHGWNRVSNSHNIRTMSTYNETEGEIIPVGPYTYTPETYKNDFGSETASSEIIFANGYDTMYESYALMLPADGLYSSPSWHVMMCSAKPVVVRKDDGKIDPNKSYLLVHEQGQSGTNGNTQPTPQSNGKPIYPLGTVDNKYTFSQLVKKGYIPFTFKEFVGQDPIEPGKAWLGHEDAPEQNGADLTLDQIFGKSVGGNYVVNVIFVTVKDAEGKVLYSYDPSVITNLRRTPVSLIGAMRRDELAAYANGTNTIHIEAWLANGEVLDAFHTVLKVD